MTVSVCVTAPVADDIDPAAWPAGPSAPIEADLRWLNAMRSRMGDSGVLFQVTGDGGTVLAAYGNVCRSPDEYEAYNLGRLLAVGPAVFPLSPAGYAARSRIERDVGVAAWYPSLVVTLPGYRCGVVGPAGHDGNALDALLRAIEAWAAEAGCAAVGLLYLDDTDSCLRAVAGKRGYQAAPLTTRCTLPVTWADFAGYAATLPGHRRKRVRQERAALRRAGVAASVVPIADVAGEVVAMRCVALQRHGQQADAAAERDRLARVRAAMGDDALTTLVATQDGHAAAFALFVSSGDRALCMWSGEVAGSAATGCHFEAAYYAPAEHWAGTRTTLDYGIGHARTKRLRGCVPAPVDAAFFAIDERLATAVTAAAAAMREHGGDDE